MQTSYCNFFHKMSNTIFDTHFEIAEFCVTNIIYPNTLPVTKSIFLTVNNRDLNKFFVNLARAASHLNQFEKYFCIINEIWCRFHSPVSNLVFTIKD